MPYKPAQPSRASKVTGLKTWWANFEKGRFGKATSTQKHDNLEGASVARSLGTQFATGNNRTGAHCFRDASEGELEIRKRTNFDK
jgi:hypothetical protein